jgi:hypothetical protein
MSSNARRIVLFATLFNLLFEYSMRGLNNLPRQPLLPFILVVIYGSLFTMQDDLIRRYKFGDVHLMVLPLIYGAIYQAFVSGAAFLGRTFLGVNWGSLFFTLFIWWGALQAVLTFYLANRLARRDWSAPLLSRSAWAAALALNLGAVLVFQMSGAIPRGTPMGYWMIGVVALAGFLLLGRMRPARDSRPVAFQPSRVLDALAVLTAIVFLFSALVLTKDPALLGASLVNLSAVKLITRWTWLLAGALLTYRWLTRKPIPV